MPKSQNTQATEQPTGCPPQVSIVIPTLNEAENIASLISDIMEAVAGKLDPEIIIADGDSEDGTQQIVASLASRYPVRLLSCGRERGLAGAVVEGARAAISEIVLVMDADHSHPAHAIPALVAPILRNDSDLVIGSRYMAGGSTPGWSRWRRLISRAAGLMTWPFTDLRDPLAGFFAVRRQLLLNMSSTVGGFKIGLEMALHTGEEIRAMEVPIAFRERAGGKSKMGGRVILQYLRQMLILAGGVVSVKTASRFGVVGLGGLVTDIAVFQTLAWSGISLGRAHVLSFLAATVFNFVLNKYWTFAGAGAQALRGGAAYMRFFAVCLLALFIRGGILGVLTKLWDVPPMIAILAAIGPAAAVNYLGSALFVFPTAISDNNPVRRWQVGAVGVVIYSMLLRLVYLGLPDLLPQEAYYWNYSQHLDYGYLDHPPMVAWLIWLGEAVFGHSEFAVRIAAFLCWMVTSGFVYGFARNMFGKFEGLLSVMLLSILPMYFASGFFMTPDAPLMAAWAGALFFLERVLLAEQRTAWWGAGACIGLGLLSKYTMVLIGLPVLAFMLIDARSRRWLWDAVPYGAALLGMAVFSPVLIWNAKHDWASFTFQSVRRIQEVTNSSFLEFTLSSLLLLTPLFLLSLLLGWSLFSPGSGTGGALPTGADARREGMFMILFTLLPFSVFLYYSLSHEARFYWSAPAWLSLFPAVGWSINRGLAPVRGLSARVPRLWMPLLLGLMIVYGVGLHYVVLGLPGIGYNEQMRATMNWRDLGRQVEDIEERLEKETGAQPLIVGMDRYFISSLMAFYDGPHPDESERDHTEREGAWEVTGSHIFGFNSLMYESWFEERPKAGTPLIMLSHGTSLLTGKNLKKCFSTLDPVQPLEAKRDGMVVGRYYSRVGYWAASDCRL